MTTRTAMIASEGWGRRADEFVPEPHRQLPMVRILLPMRAKGYGQVVRWSEYVSVDDELASLDWREVVERNAEERPEVRGLVSCRGELDAATAGGFADVVGDSELTSLRWMGYAGNPFTNHPVRVHGNDFFPSPLQRSDLHPGERIPEFAWDSDVTIAWGGRLYPDSLICDAGTLSVGGTF